MARQWELVLAQPRAAAAQEGFDVTLLDVAINISVAPGTRRRHSIELTELTDGTRVSILLDLINGAQPRPRLSTVAPPSTETRLTAPEYSFARWPTWTRSACGAASLPRAAVTSGYRVTHFDLDAEWRRSLPTCPFSASSSCVPRRVPYWRTCARHAHAEGSWLARSAEPRSRHGWTP